MKKDKKWIVDRCLRRREKQLFIPSGDDFHWYEEADPRRHDQDCSRSVDVEYERPRYPLQGYVEPDPGEALADVQVAICLYMR